MKLFHLIIIFLPLIAYSQDTEQEVIAKIILLSAKRNDIDITSSSMASNPLFVFYYNNKNQVYFAKVNDEEQNFGYIYMN